MKLTVIMVDTYRTYAALIHENESKPYGRRTVQIELTPEQMAAIKPRALGTTSQGDEIAEEIGQCWLEE